MPEIRKFINKLSKFQKVTCLILILGFVLFLSVGIPTLARYKNRSTLITASVWDGSVADSYRDGNGTEEDPYIISNGSELAYFSMQLSSNDYTNTYFALSNDILLNEGIFNYDSTNKIQYIIGSQTYYVDEFTNKYYDNIDMSGTEIGTINMFNSLDSFKGHFDGCSFTIYGLYIADESSDEVSLFTDLQGNLSNLYVENTIVYGGIVTAGIASTTNNASLSNVLFDGYVVGRSTMLTKSVNASSNISTINLQHTEMTDYIDLTNNIPVIGSTIVSTSITGNYIINGSSDAETSIKINGVTVTNGSFEIDLGSSIKDSISVLTYTTSDDATLVFSDLKYNIVYNYAVAGGIVGICNNTTIENTVNKASIYGYTVSGGLVGVTTTLVNINQSYNTGSINSEYVSGGLVGTIEKSNNNIVISKSYNTADMFAPNIGGLIGIIDNNTGSISISNVFNTSNTNYSIGTIDSSTVNVMNAYFVNGSEAINNGVITGNFTLTSMSNLKTKSYDISNLSFNEFINFDDLAENDQNVWVYEYDALPMLFIDDLINPIANINVNVYSWNNLSYELSNVKLTSNITFSIEDADNLRPVKEKYYYISNSREALTQEDILGINSWSAYNDIVQISAEGLYVVYVKVVDYDDNVTYMNTDLLILDLSGATASVSIDDNLWSNLRDNLDYVYIDRSKSVTIEASDSLSGISSIKYYVTDEILNTTELNSLSEGIWTTYTNGIPINEVGKYIVYVQVIDNCNYTTYINTDYIVLNGYTESSLTVGRNSSSYMNEPSYVTNKSTITLNLNYSNSSASEMSNYTHNLMSNIMLLMGTKITLIDNVTEQVYEYQIPSDTDIYNYNNSCVIGDLDCIKVATYPFTLFKEVGTGATDKNFVESTYYTNGVVNEDFTIVLDLSNTDIGVNYNNVALYTELHDTNDKNVRPTLYSTIKEFNIYSIVNSENTNASLYLNTNYNGNEIAFNSESITNINITSGLNYKYVNGFKITDTTYEDKEIGLSIKLVDSDGNIVDKDNFKNIIFKIGDSTYYPDEDNIVHINLQSGIAESTQTLTIITYENNSNLGAGTYYFKISNYASYDGNYYDELSNTEISIPVSVLGNNSNIKYSFDVIMDDSNRIISKIDNTSMVPFSILQNGSLHNPNIRVSLYKKNQLTAYNQDYSIVDLASYVSDTLNSCTSNVYYVSTNPIQYNKYTKLYNSFELNLVTANFENTGYKFIFDLYDGTKKVGTIEKYFIVK